MGVFSRQQGIAIFRPLLDSDRAQLEAYSSHNGLTWIDDPANQDPRFERNFLRHQMLPHLRERWPQLNQTLARAGRLSREAAELLDELAQLDLGEPRPDGGLSLAALAPLSQARARNLIRRWLRQQGAALPSEVQLQRVLDEILPAPIDARPELVWGEQAIRRYQDVLYCVPDLPLPPAHPVPFDPQQPEQTNLAGHLISQNGQGTAFSRAALGSKELTLRFRQGGEQAKPAGRHTRSLKQLLQDYKVPPWWRDHWPLLYQGEQLVGLPGLFACTGFEPQSDADALWLGWRPPSLGSPSR
jgi:tRNA(Ile)-lysidine synthase